MGSRKQERAKQGVIREKGRRTVKKKSIKSRAFDINHARRIKRAAALKKKGQVGYSIEYITRRRAMKKLQLNLHDFQRLCILKGIYPREPPKKNLNRTCYHVKDISYLAHEPLLQHFNDMKAYMKKVFKHLHRDNQPEAKRKYEYRPHYTLDHLIKERYPRFQDSLADMEDAMTLIHLFANMYAKRPITHERTANCLRLTREWQLYIVLSRSLRKTFVSVKGIYYQAEILGQEVTWLVPHKFSQNFPGDLNINLFNNFLEFYECLAGFVMFKLYHMLGIRYPPRLDQELDKDGAHLACIQLERIGAKDEGSDKSPNDEGENLQKVERKNKKEPHDKEKLERMKTLDKKMQSIMEGQNGDDEQEDNVENEDGGDDEVENQVFAEDENARHIAEKGREIEAQTNLFKGLTFWLSREVPFEPLEFLIRAFGGNVLDEIGGASSSDPRITHFVTDRPNIKCDRKDCEYIQPQWAFDCVNWRVRFPVQRYAPGQELPPHLSPFVDNEAVGYRPDFLQDIEKLQAAAGVPKEQYIPQNLIPAPPKRAPEVDEEEDEEDDDEDILEEEEEKRFAEEIEEELKMNKKAKKRQREEDDAKEESFDETEKPETETGTEDEEERTKKKKKRREENFIPSARFKGAKGGYVFKIGSRGLGYYKDVNKDIEITYKPDSKAQSKRQRRLAQKKEEHNMAKMMMNKKARNLYGRMQHGIQNKKREVEELKRKRDVINRKK